MKLKIVVPAVLILSALIMFGCGPTGVGDETSSTCYPKNLQVDVNHGTMDIYWENSCSRLISGYNIYISENPIVEKYPGAELPSDVKPFNPGVYAGDTNPDDEFEHFIAEGLENGKKFYVSVRVVNPDRTMSKPSNEVMAVCGASGEIELTVRYKSEQDGFSFEQNGYVRADDLENDIYFFSNDQGDYLNSPVKLNGFLKDNKLEKLSYRGTFDDIRENLLELSSSPNEEKLMIQKGDWVHVQTVDGGNAFLQIRDINGSGPDRKVKIFFAYNSLAGEILF